MRKPGKKNKTMNQENDLNPQPNGEQQILPFDPPLDEMPPADPSETETLRAQCSELQLRLRLLESRDELTAALRSAGARSPELVFAVAKEGIKFGDDGSVENAEALVAEMKRRYPEQFAQANAPSIDGGAGRDPSPNSLTKEVLAKMKPDEIAKLDWDHIKTVLSS